MDKFAEKLAGLFGSTPFILMHIVGFGVWIMLHHAIGFDEHWDILTVWVEMEVIILSLFILRAENVQTSRFEEDVRRDLGQSRRILKEVHKTSKNK